MQNHDLNAKGRKGTSSDAMKHTRDTRLTAKEGILGLKHTEDENHEGLTLSPLVDERIV